MKEVMFDVVLKTWVILQADNREKSFPKQREWGKSKYISGQKVRGWDGQFTEQKKYQIWDMCYGCSVHYSDVGSSMQGCRQGWCTSDSQLSLEGRHQSPERRLCFFFPGSVIGEKQYLRLGAGFSDLDFDSAWTMFYFPLGCAPLSSWHHEICI